MAKVIYQYPLGPRRVIGEIIDHDSEFDWILVELTQSQLPPTKFYYQGAGRYRASGTHNSIPLEIEL